MDKTFLERNVPALEGNPNRPEDFNHVENRKNRMIIANKIAEYLTKQGHDMTHWAELCQGKRDPWAKMLAADVNNQMMQMKPKEKL